MLVVKVFDNGDIKTIDDGRDPSTSFGLGVYATHSLYLRKAERVGMWWVVELGTAFRTRYSFRLSDEVFQKVVANAVPWD